MGLEEAIWWNEYKVISETTRLKMLIEEIKQIVVKVLELKRNQVMVVKKQI